MDLKMTHIYNTGNRLHWIDIAKGILIILVVYGHIDYFANTFAHSSVFDFKGCTNIFFLPYYMPAFFVITGYCSNFDVPFPIFIKKNLKTLIIPSILIGGVLEPCLFLFLGEGLSFYSLLEIDYLQLLYTGGTWFLASLCIAKIILHILRSLYNHDLFLIFGSVLIMILGSYLYSHSINPNLWSYQHAMILCPFLWLGLFLKQHIKILDYKWAIVFLGGLSMGGYVYLYLSNIPWPYVNANPAVDIHNVLPYFIMASMLILLFLLICRSMEKCTWLEMLGKHSLVIYLVHRSIFVFLIKLSIFKWIEGENLITKIMFSIFAIYVTVMICIWIDKVISKNVGFMKGYF